MATLSQKSKLTIPMRKVYLLSLLIVGLSFFANAQSKTPQQQLDSLLLISQNHSKNDSLKVLILKQVYKQYMKLKRTDKVEEYVSKTILLAQKINLKGIAASSYYNIGIYYHGLTKYQKAEEYYLKSLDKYTILQDSVWIAGVNLNLGALYNGIADYAKSLAVNQNAIAIYQKINRPGDLASCYVNVSGIYTALGQPQNALNYLSKALAIFLKLDKNGRGAAVVYNNIGTAYFNSSDDDLKQMGIDKSSKYRLSLENLNKGLAIAKNLSETSTLGEIYRDLGTVYEGLDNKELALTYYSKALELNSELDDKSYSAETLLALSRLHEKSQDYQSAMPLLLEALKIGKEFNLASTQRDTYYRLSSIEQHLGNYNKALTYFKDHIHYRDLIFNQENEKEITRRRLQLDFAVKEQDYLVRDKITNAELRTQLLRAEQQQQQLILRKNELMLSEQAKSLQRLTFLAKEADLENASREKEDMLIQEKLTNALKDREIVLQKAELTANRSFNTIISLIAIILLVFAVFVFYAQRKTMRLNKIVSQQKQELENLGKVKDRIFSVVSHDMRSPVNSLISFMQLLEDGMVSQDKLIKYAGSLKDNLGYTSAMMENLLNWASSQMNGYNVINQKFDAQLCVNEVVAALQFAADKKEIVINNRISSGTLCIADMSMMCLILRNMISNAIKFTADKGEINISTSTINDSILFLISDNGIGLTIAQIESFNSENEIDTLTNTYGTNNEKGTGIGLMLCKNFAKLMNGKLSVNSELGKGTVFTLTLPQQL